MQKNDGDNNLRVAMILKIKVKKMSDQKYKDMQEFLDSMEDYNPAVCILA